MSQMRPSQALVRPPSSSFVHAISSSGADIDLDQAAAQHLEYRRALAAAGLAVELLPPDERYPDSCFVQDPAIVIRGQGVVCRMGAASREGEEVSLANALSERGVPLARILPPGTLEGGDVLVLPDRVFVGQTSRSNQDGILQLGRMLESFELPVAAIPVPGYLHLLSAATYIGHGTALAVEAYATHPALCGMDVIWVPRQDAYAVNALGIGGYIVLPAGYPRVAGALEARGFTVLTVPMSEFAKADGGVTCLSLLW